MTFIILSYIEYQSKETAIKTFSTGHFLRDLSAVYDKTLSIAVLLYF